MSSLKDWTKASTPDWVLAFLFKAWRRFDGTIATRTPLVMCATRFATGQMPVAEPYSIQLLHGDGPAPGWIETLASAGIQVTAQTWTNDFARHPTARVIGVTHDGQVVGTAGIAPIPPADAGVGLLTWVGLRREHQGRGLGKPIIAAALREAAASGMHTVLLLTDDHRLPAIQTYLGTGFRPCLNSWDWTHRPRWTSILRALKREAIGCRDRSHAVWVSRIN